MSWVYAYQLKLMWRTIVYSLSFAILKYASYAQFIIIFNVLSVANVSLYPLPYKGARANFILKSDPPLIKVPEAKVLMYNF